MIILRNINTLNNWRGCVNFSTLRALQAQHEWIVSRWVPPKRNDILINLPDYTFLDQRPSPYGTRQRRRIEQQKMYTAKIVKLTSEVDLAMTLYKQREAAKQASIDERISKKLTEKGSKTVGD
ncbi:large ribosomal subunit protein mL52 [Halyomorpha halys]|uniref:large ribosomal subunit protein mL52 n=1 Tax=Halyomorpha halys TaxID=286706 RepID=UPI0006D4F643|nr:39S ribosomal protein L52, mitochondrial [Halyomorpha halys]